MVWKILNLVAAILYLLAGGYIIFRFKDKLPYKSTTVFLTLLIFILQIVLSIEAYDIDIKHKPDNPIWRHFKYALPTANISSFMFFMVFIVLFLPKIIKNHF